ncbi:PilX N-terminal domain-containing pilus assembly protein [Deinococcus ficus]|uniref:PilX N-terminal domain-containing pilus assembly protein n=1 Tax=Deinococcus ficus TaxID=317577 RepID=UPI00040CD381|nr:PilX N-terminal domain-containing pilus assembly protein [Deinococcus ficus]
MSDTLPPRAGLRPRRQDGVALVVVLLFTVVILMIIVSTTATMSLGARTGGVNERAAYQALLNSESAVNTFAQRFQAKMATLDDAALFRGTEPDDLQAWIVQYGLNTYNGATLSVTGRPSKKNFSIEAVGTVQGETRKAVLQDFYATHSPGFNIRADAPLVSYPNVDVTGNASVEGESYNTNASGLKSDGTTTIARLTGAADLPGTDIQLTSTLTDQLLLSKGNYVVLNNTTFKVTGVNYKTSRVTLASLDGTTTTTNFAASTPIRRVDSAVTTPFTQVSGGLSVINVTDPEYFVDGSRVRVGNMTGTVVSTDETNKRVTINWDVSTTLTATIPEGAAIARDVKAVQSGYGVTGQDQTYNGVSSNDLRLRNMNPFNSNSNPDLFTFVLGQTKAQMLNYPANNWNGWVDVTTTGQNFNGRVGEALGGKDITFIDGTTSLSGSQQLCGSGLLIVKGNLTVNGTCDAGFSGAIYVMGDYDQQGNSTIRGAVIAEGATQIINGTECVSIPPSDTNPGGNDCDTKVAGTGQGQGKITFDRAALLAAGALLSPPTFDPVAGTWRQR